MFSVISRESTKMAILPKGFMGSREPSPLTCSKLIQQIRNIKTIRIFSRNMTSFERELVNSLNQVMGQKRLVEPDLGRGRRSTMVGAVAEGTEQRSGVTK